ncbi:Cytochrome P450 2 sub R member 1 [Chamberlinius hualienensis]|uniref:Cytochrome P450 3201G2 n=1 Tax=Chamberlinius hualienensis TaxID=1551368 RepID=A0A1J1E8R1_9MYRI|nr:cytochrome P450 3201G2 [Chamberlinius hualienensis]
MEVGYVWSFIYALITAIFIRWIIKRVIILVKLPPGPWGLPLVGYLPWITKDAYKSFIDIAKLHGGLFSVNLGSETVVILNDWKSVKATLIDQPKVFSGRKYLKLTEATIQNNDVAWSEGNVWQIQRKLTLKCLTNIGLVNKSMESHIVDLVQEVTEKLTRYNNKEVPMESMFFSSILQTNWKFVSVDPIDNNKLREYEDAIKELFKRFHPDNPLLIFEWLRFIPPNGFGYKAILKASQVVTNTLRETINSHLNEWKDGDVNDFIDYYIAEIKKRQVSGQKNEKPFTIDNLLGSVFDMFTAGVDTINSTCLWAFLFLTYNPDIQRKAQQELDAVVGRLRMPNLYDFTNLPYIEAIIMEVHRKASLAPLAVPHRTMEDAKVFGYTIPKGTTCYPNIYAIHNDSTLWDKPEEFNPARFLDNNNKVVWPSYLIPFSVGPRACLGKHLAQMELKIIIASLLHKFNFKCPIGSENSSFAIENGLTLHPQPYSLLIQLRND